VSTGLRFIGSAFIATALGVTVASAQFATSAAGASGSTRATPSVQRQSSPGSVATQQSTSGGGVQTINTEIQVSGDLSGSVRSADVPPGAIQLTLAEAVKRGIAANLGPVTAANSARLSHARTIQARSSLMPNISVNASETVTQINLAAFGFKFNLPPGLNFSFPSVVGPFSYSQLQGNLSQSVYDPVQRHNLRAAREEEQASVLNVRDARELVVLAVAGAYLETLATSARVESQRAQVANAEAVSRQAEVRRAAGTNAKIDVMRTLVELQTQQQRLNALEGDLHKEKIDLARLIGLPLDRDIVLTEQMIAPNANPPEVLSATSEALERRRDIMALEAQVRAAEQSVAAARAERMPSVSLNGDYGVLGPNPASAHGVFAITGAVNIPVWQGGRVKGDVEEAETILHQREAELADQRGRVEQEVRSALIDLQTAITQVRLADTNRGYAAETLQESRDRFSLGVTTSVEVVQAQEQVAGAESDYIASLFSYDVARIALARAVGAAETTLPGLLKESGQ